MSKKQKNPNTRDKNHTKKEKEINKPITILILVRRLQFTFLEDCIVKIIEKYEHASDKKIADILCLAEKDISRIIDHSWENNGGLNKQLEGDCSRRTFKNGWEKKEMAIIKTDDKNKEKNKKKYQFYTFEKENDNKEFALGTLKNLHQLKNNIEKKSWNESPYYCNIYQEYLKEFAKLEELSFHDIPRQLKNEKIESIYKANFKQ